MTSSFYAVLFVATFPAPWVLAAVLDRILPDRSPRQERPRHQELEL